MAEYSELVGSELRFVGVRPTPPSYTAAPLAAIGVVCWSSWRVTVLNFQVLHWEGIPLHDGQRGLSWRTSWVARGSCATLDALLDCGQRAAIAGARHGARLACLRVHDVIHMHAR